MSMIYLISYDLNEPNKDYKALYEEIKTAPGWAHIMESVWLISTSKTIEHWSDKLREVMDDNDQVFVVDITGQARQGWLKTTHWEWIKKYDK